MLSGFEMFIAMSGATYFKTACQRCVLSLVLLTLASGCNKPSNAPTAKPDIPKAQQEANVTGTWDIYAYQTGAADTLEITDPNGVITGTLSVRIREMKYNVHGIRAGNQIQWGYSGLFYQGSTDNLHETYNGTIAGDKMSGSATFDINFGQAHNGLWTATKR